MTGNVEQFVVTQFTNLDQPYSTQARLTCFPHHFRQLHIPIEGVKHKIPAIKTLSCNAGLSTTFFYVTDQNPY